MSKVLLSYTNKELQVHGEIEFLEQTTKMATPVRTSMRTRRSKRPVSPPVEEKRKRKTNVRDCIKCRKKAVAVIGKPVARGRVIAFKYLQVQNPKWHCIIYLSSSLLLLFLFYVIVNS